LGQYPFQFRCDCLGLVVSGNNNGKNGVHL
jgi:hypothetical protein